MTNATDLEFYIRHRKEERYLEYKSSHPDHGHGELLNIKRE